MEFYWEHLGYPFLLALCDALKAQPMKPIVEITWDELSPLIVVGQTRKRWTMPSRAGYDHPLLARGKRLCHPCRTLGKVGREHFSGQFISSGNCSLNPCIHNGWISDVGLGDLRN